MRGRLKFSTFLDFIFWAFPKWDGGRRGKADLSTPLRGYEREITPGAEAPVHDSIERPKAKALGYLEAKTKTTQAKAFGYLEAKTKTAKAEACGYLKRRQRQPRLKPAVI